MFYEKLIRILPSFSDKKAALRIVLDVEREVSAYLISITLINAGLAAAVGQASGPSACRRRISGRCSPSS